MIKRLAARLSCNIETQACTPIETVPACIVDISRLGAQLRLERPYPKGTRIHLDVEGHYYWGTVMWDEVDRVGLRFRNPIDAGPLDEALKRLQAPRAVPSPAGLSAGRAGGFGRRLGAVRG